MILHSVSIPLFIFAAVLTALLLLSITLFLPLFTQVKVAGVERDARSLLTYKAQLAAQVATLELERDTSVLPLNDPAYDALKAERRTPSSFIAMREEVIHSAKSLSPVDDAIHLNAITLEQGTLVLEGDVRNVGPRSLTLLSEFTEGCKNFSFTASVTPPLYTRKDDPVVGVHSPFRIVLRLN